MNGILVVDKPKGLTSHDVVDLIRKKFQLKKVGHAGTLDPEATGVLIILIGTACKMSSELSGHDKQYQACLSLGTATDSEDATGEVLKRSPVKPINSKQLDQVLHQFLGQIKQVPPMFSALKHKGRRLYVLARKGIEVRRQKRSVSIYELKLTKHAGERIWFSVKCSKGTYIRTLCVDIAKELGYPGHLCELRRIKSGPFGIEQALGLDELNRFSSNQLGEKLLQGISNESN